MAGLIMAYMEHVWLLPRYEVQFNYICCNHHDIVGDTNKVLITVKVWLMFMIYHENNK